jgi:hypothetical protein
MTPKLVLRSLQVGDIGWVAHRQGILYAQEYGWDGTFEALVAEIAAQFVKNFDPEKENAWIAECEGRVVGSAFVVKVSDTEAKLRLLYVAPERFANERFLQLLQSVPVTAGVAVAVSASTRCTFSCSARRASFR